SHCLAHGGQPLGGRIVNVHNSGTEAALPADGTTDTTVPGTDATTDTTLTTASPATTATTDLAGKVDSLDQRVTIVENKVSTIEATTSTTAPRATTPVVNSPEPTTTTTSEPTTTTTTPPAWHTIANLSWDAGYAASDF